MRERDIEGYLHRRVRELGGTHRRVKWLGRNKAPDDRIMLPGNCFWAECKAPDASMNTAHAKAQLREHERMRRCGEVVHVLDSFEAVDRVLGK